MRAAYLAGPPLLALATRVMSPNGLGLVPPNSGASVLVAAAAATAVAATVIGGRLWYARTAGEGPPPRRATPTGPECADMVWEALLCECHWAFVRAGAWAVPGTTPGQAATASVLLLALGAWSDPVERLRIQAGRAAHSLARGGALAVLSGAVFATTGSSVLAWALHVAVGLTWRVALGDPALDVRAEPATPGRPG